MDQDLRQRMLAYYDERSHEYEEAYTLGTGTASIRNPAVFKAEVPVVARIVAEIARGRLIDLACGTAYWMPHYGANCSRMTLFDQSPRMLAEARAKADDEAEEPLLFDALRAMLAPSGRFLIFDSAWSAEREKVNVKVGRQTRLLNDGTAFEIYKRYLDTTDVARWARNHGAALRIEHLGPAFCVASGTFGS